MDKCCSMDLKSICEKFECSMKETADGVQIELKAKDASKKESLKALIKACHDFCGCC